MKRFISIFLTVCMLISMIPAVSAQRTPANVTIEYDIKSILTKGGNSSGAAANWGASNIPASDFSYPATKGFFHYVGNSTNSSGVIDASKIKWNQSGLYLSDNSWWAFKIYVPRDGVYVPKVNYGMKNASTNTLYVSLVKADETANLTSAVDSGKLKNNGEVKGIPYDKSVLKKDKNGALTDTWTDEDDNPLAHSFDEVELTQGEYYVIYSGGYSGWVLVNNFILDGGSGNTYLMSPVVSVSEKSVEAESSITLSPIVYDTSGKKVENATFEYSAENAVAVVDGNGKVTGVSEGMAKIKVTAKAEDYASVSTVVEIPVTPLPALTGPSITYDIASKMGKWKDANKETPFSSFTYKSTNGFWEYAANSTGEDYVNTTNTNFVQNQGMHLTANTWWAIKIYVPESGEYMPVLSHGERNATGVGTINAYLAKADGAFDVDAAVSEENRIAEINYKNTTLVKDAADVYTTTNLENVTLVKGEYYLVYKATGGYIRVGNLTLRAGNDTALMRPILIEERTVLEVEEALEISAEVYTNLGEKIQAEIAFSSLDKEKAIVAGTSLIGIEEGIVEIKADATYNGLTSFGVTEFTITPATEYAGENIIYDIASYMGTWNGSADKPDIYVPFSSLKYEKTDGNWNYLSNSSGLDWPTRGSGGVNYIKGWGVQLDKDVWWAMEIKVPASGKYKPQINYGKHNYNFGYLDVFLVPISAGEPTDETFEKIIAENTPLVHINTLDTTLEDTIKQVLTLDNIQLDEGRYYLIYKATNARTQVGNFFLEGKNSIKYAESTIDKNEIGYGETAKITHVAKNLAGMVMNENSYTVSYDASPEGIVNISPNGTVTGIGDGEAVIKMLLFDNGNSVETSVSIKATDTSPTIGNEVKTKELLYVREAAKFEWFVLKESKNKLEIPFEDITFSFEPEGALEASDGVIRAVANSEEPLSVTVTATFRGEDLENTFEISVREDESKRESTYYTPERRQIALKNISKYSWAKSAQKSAISKAESYLQNYKEIYNLITYEGIPRGRQIGRQNDPDFECCRYCGSEIVAKYGSSGTDGWGFNPIIRPWQVQCIDCKRLFPSNDFESFYKLGLDEKGQFDRQRALDAHRTMLAQQGKIDMSITEAGEEFDKNGYKNQQWLDYYGFGIEGGYLYNKLYPEIAERNLDPFKKDKYGNGLPVDGTLWGVDDSMGYYPGRKYENGIIEHHGYIAYAHYERWDYIHAAICALRDAYLHTGDKEYGVAGLALLDRVADVYPTFDTSPYNGVFFNSAGATPYGAIQGRIVDATHAQDFALAADAFFTQITDGEVVSFLSEKADEFGLKNKKESSKDIWANIENRLLLQIFENTKLGRVGGNFGWSQAACALAATALDKEPETTEIFKWIYQKDTSTDSVTKTGGNVGTQLVDIVDRDGFGNEAAPSYNTTWPQVLFEMCEAINRYAEKHEEAKEYDLLQNPKYLKMLTAPIYLVLVNKNQPNIGDCGNVSSTGQSGATASFETYFKYLKDTEYGKLLANYIYMRRNYDLSDMHYDIFTENPESMKDDIAALMDDTPEQKSDMAPAYGIAILRDGTASIGTTSQTMINNLRDFYVYFGMNDGHGHPDTLNLCLDAFGLDFGADLGYPATTGKNPQRLEWVEATLAHNTVVVDGVNQNLMRYPGYPLHFDDAGQVKLVDVDAAAVYDDTDIYRRSVVMIKIDDDVSYGVDFFRIRGGEQHTFSFHTQSHNATAVSGLEMTPDPVVQDELGNDIIGSYVGPETPYGPDPVLGTTWFYDTIYPRGYTWMKNVRRDESPGNIFSVDFEITDYRKTIADSKGLHLHMTQMNEFTPDEVAFAGGTIPTTSNNNDLLRMTDTLDYVLVQHEGEEGLESLFTTVYEPYKTTRKIKRIEHASFTGRIADGEVARAVKVTHERGRIDYVVYSTDASAQLRVDGLFDFQGFIGVYSIDNAENKACIYRYVNDGTVINGDNDESILREETQSPAAYKGEVVDFQRDMSTYNYIDVKGDGFDVAEITGRYIYIDNDTDQNGVYRIESAEDLGEGMTRLHTGKTTLIHSYKDAINIDNGYNYNIAVGDSFKIPLSYSDDYSPVSSPVSDVTVSARSAVKVTVNATSPAEETIKYYAGTVPRGASVNEATGEVTWKPDSSQIGKNHFAIIARDESGREVGIHFDVTVYGSTTSKPSNETDDGATGTITPSGGGGGGAPTDKPDDATNTDEPGTAETPDNTDTGEKAPEASGETDNIRFTDLSDHAWAADAITTLADDGIIRGTTSDTYSPANNITRADFASLLVRAFKFTSDNAENFADVTASDYFASELAIARNNGIISGIGDNKFAPRNTITRQDMMVIVYRALQKLNVGVGACDEPQYPDFSTVAPYAKEAVSALVGSGLVNGKSGRIAPTDYTTRAEVAVLIKRILDYVK